MTSKNYKNEQDVNMEVGMSLAWILLILTSVPRLATSLYVPALPMMSEKLGISPDQLAGTLTVYFVVFAMSTLVAGPMTDAIGRRWVVLGGLVFLIIGSAVGAVAGALTLLLVARALQAVGGAFIPVAGRVMVRDAYSDDKVMSVIGWMGTLGVLVPVFAIFFGGLIVEYISWQATFYILAIIAAITLLWAWKRTPETLAERVPMKLNRIFPVYWSIFRSPAFLIVVIPISLCFAIQGAYFATAPFIFIHDFGFKATTFGFFNVALVASLILGRLGAIRLVKRFSLYSIYLLSAVLPLIGGIILLIASKQSEVSFIVFIFAACLYALGFGGLIPIGMKSILTAFREQGGMTSALFGCITIGSSAFGTSGVGYLSSLYHTLPAFALLTFVCGIFITLSAVMCRKLLI